jgi:hypothetical protein
MFFGSKHWHTLALEENPLQNLASPSFEPGTQAGIGALQIPPDVSVKL